MRAIHGGNFGATFARVGLAGVLLAGVIACSPMGMCQAPSNQPFPSDDTASKSLGDVARENQKQKPSQDKDKGSKVITNSELSSGAEEYNLPKSRTNKFASSATNSSSNSKTTQHTAVDPRVVEQWKKQIAAQKNVIANTQAQIAELKVTIISIDPSFATHSRETEDYASMSYNYRLAKQLARLHTLEVQLAQQRQRLDEMQETARHAGMHTLTYDP